MGKSFYEGNLQFLSRIYWWPHRKKICTAGKKHFSSPLFFNFGCCYLQKITECGVAIYTKINFYPTKKNNKMPIRTNGGKNEKCGDLKFSINCEFYWLNLLFKDN